MKQRYTVGVADKRQVMFDLDSDVECERRLAEPLSNHTMIEPEVLQLLFRFLTDGDCFVDIGANAGYFSVLASAMVGPRGKVIACEPGTNVLPALRHNIAINKMDNVEVITQPLADKTREVLFCLADEGPSFNCLWNPESPHEAFAREAVAMQATTLDALLANRPTPKLVKMDAEGAEHLIMKGAYDTLFKHKVPFIVAELADVNLMRLGSSQSDLRRYMYLMGYDTWIAYADGSLPKWLPPMTQLRGQFVFNVLYAARDDVALFWPHESHEPHWVPR